MKMKTILASVFTAGAMALLAGCSPAVESGVVVQKDYIPAHEERRQGGCIMYTKVGDVQICSAYDYYTVNIPDKWHVTLADAEENTETHSIRQEVYDAIDVGQNFAIDGCLNTKGPGNC